MRLAVRIVLVGLLGLALMSLGVVPVDADTNLFEIEGTLFVQGNNSCAGPCVQALAFSLTGEFVPFVPDRYDDPTWTHRFVVHASDNVISAGPLGTFTTPGQSFQHFFDLGDPFEFVPFVNGPEGTPRDHLELLSLGQGTTWWTSTPWVAPIFNSAQLFACGTPECKAAFGPGIRTGFATVVVRKVPEPLPLLLVVLGIAALGVTGQWRKQARLGETP